MRFFIPKDTEFEIKHCKGIITNAKKELCTTFEERRVGEQNNYNIITTEIEGIRSGLVRGTLFVK